MYLIYMDEAGYSGRNLEDQAQPIHVMAATIIRDTKWKELEKHYDDFCKKAWKNYPPRPLKSEVHAGEIFQGSGVFRRWTRDHRLELLKSSLNAFNDYDLPIIFGAIDKTRLKDQSPDLFRPHSLAFTFCVQLIEEWFRANANDETGMLICDETTERWEFKVSLKQYQKYGLETGLKNLKLDHIVDTIHFADSHESYGIQLADTANYFIKRFLEGKKNAKDYYDVIRRRIWDSKMIP